MIFAGSRGPHQQVHVTTSVAHTQVQRYKRVCWFLIIFLIIISAGGFSVGIYTFVYVKNLQAGAFYPHIAFVLSLIMCIFGILKKSREKALLSVGIFMLGLSALIGCVGALIDGVHAYHILNTPFENCSYNAVVVMMFQCPDSNCQLTLKPNMCYCCQLYQQSNCRPFTLSFSVKPSVFEGVNSCHSVEVVYHILLWTSVAICLACTLMSLFTMVILRRFKWLSLRCPSAFITHQQVAVDQILASPYRFQQTDFSSTKSGNSSSNSLSTIKIPPAYTP